MRGLSFRRLNAKLFSSIKSDERAYFDDHFYKSDYPDIAAAGIDAFRHYMTHGWREGRNPSQKFNTLFYRDRYLGGAEINPLTHFVQAGGESANARPVPSAEDLVEIQRAVIADWFDLRYYLQQVGDIGSQDPVDHYLTLGWKEGRSPNPSFDLSKYCGQHPFVKTLDVTPFYHFVSQARMKRQSAASAAALTGASQDSVPVSEVVAILKPEFDAAFYLKQNPDVRTANRDPLLHFIEYGWREGRNPTALFDLTYYLASNKEVAKAGINPFFHYVTVGRQEGRRPNPVGTRLYPPMRAPSRDAWDGLTPAASTDDADYIIVMPVYSGYDETLASIHAVLSHPQATKFALHVINDVTPDAALDREIEALASAKLFSYEKNEVNLGFVKSVNRGLRRFSDKQIILLNADAEVFGDWLDRIDRHAKADPAIATITPLSNNATICSYPLSNANNLIEPECSAQVLDRMAAHCNDGRVSDIPTGVGFCFYMSRASREAVGILDEEAFGRGYGEENDFCLRAAKAGFRNVLAEDIFVYHAGQVSFAEFAAEEFGPGQAALIGKHPDYPLRIKQFFDADDSAWGRLRLDLYRIAKDAAPNCMVVVYHALTGGIVTHLKQMETRLREEGVTLIHIRVGVSTRWGVEIVSGSATAPYCPNLWPTPFNQIQPLLREFLGWLGPKGIHIHSLVGFDWAATSGFLDVIRQASVPYYFTLHDYSVVCHRNDLVLPNGRWCGLPDVSVCQACVATDRSYPEAIDPVVRRQTFDAFLRDAAAVFAPSEDIKTRLQGAGAGYPIIVRPHEETFDWAKVLRPPHEPERIDVVAIGAIGPHKGSRVILNLARDAKARGLPIRYHIVGYSDLTEELAAAGVTETGRYASEAEAIKQIEAIRPSCVFLPSIWPETFCYALSIAFQLEIPPVVFDLGAQRDRVIEQGFGFVAPYALIDDVQALNDRLCALPYETEFLDRRRIDRVRYRNIQQDYYDMRAVEGESNTDGVQV